MGKRRTASPATAAINVNDVFRDPKTMVRFGLAIDPAFSNKELDKPIRDLAYNLAKVLTRRIKPSFFYHLIDLILSDDPSEKTAGLNVFSLALNSVLGNVVYIKKFFNILIESYLTIEEDLASRIQPSILYLICLIHGVGQTDQPSPHPALMSLYRQSYLQGDQEARKILDKLLKIADDHYILLLPFDSIEPPEQEGLAGYRSVFWSCPDSDIVKAWCKSYLADSDKAQTLFNETTNHINLIRNRLKDIEDRLANMWKQIVQNPRYDILDGGGDSFNITGWLNRNGLERITFFREGFQFPTVGVRYVWRFFERTFTTRHPLSPKTSMTDKSRRLMELPLLIIATTCYYDIICATPLSVKLYSRTTDRGSRAVQNQSHPVKVRPHFRNLPPGWKASPQQIQAAMSRLGYLPPGHTFIPYHYRGEPVPSRSKSSPGLVAIQQEISYERIIEQLLGKSI